MAANTNLSLQSIRYLPFRLSMPQSLGNLVLYPPNIKMYPSRPSPVSYTGPDQQCVMAFAAYFCQYSVSRTIKSEVLLVEIFYETERQFNCYYTNKIQFFKLSFIPTLNFSYCILWCWKNSATFEAKIRYFHLYSYFQGLATMRLAQVAIEKK
jgi:hypothetical protein